MATHGGDRGRQQDADDLVVGVEHVAQEQPAQDERPHQQLPPVSSMPLESAIFQRNSDLAAVADHRAGQGDGALLAAGDGIGAEVLHGLANVVKMSGGSWIGLPNQIETLRGMALGHFQKNLPAAEAEDAAPQLVEEDGNDRGAGAALDFEHAGLERLQLAGAGDAAFGEDAHELAVLQGFAGGFDGVRGRLWVCCEWGCRRRSCQMPRVHQLVKRPPSMTIRTGRGDVLKSSRPSTQEMWFGTRSAPPCSGKFSRWQDADAIERVGQQPRHELDRGLRDNKNDVNEDGDRGQAAEEEDFARREADADGGCPQEPVDERGQQHAAKGEEIARRQDRAAMFGRALVLHERLQAARRTNRR